MDAKLIKAFNEQIKNEIFSAYMYLGMAAYFETINLPGFAKWMQVQTKEELGHAMKMYSFLNDVGAAVELHAIAKPAADYKSALDVMKKTLAHEKLVTAMIDNLYNLAQKLGDNAATIFLQWFVTEQVEEEKSASDVIALLDRIKPDSAQIVMLDVQMGKRGQ
ncbi:MAG: ferritin [Candidatus Omnitrophica bacterium]|nr:ferritin [Candidatus Omnitrophota bacterium]